MNIFLELSIVYGLMLITISVAIPGLVVYLVVRKLLESQLNKQHEKIGRLMFKVTASLLALLISLSYANEKIGYNKVVDSLEVEAAIIATAMLKLNMHRTKLAEKVRTDLAQYVKYTIEDDWRNVVNDPYVSKTWATISLLNLEIRALSTDTEMRALLKTSLIEDIDLITRTLQIRIYSTHFYMPYLAIILGLGLLIAWSFYSVYTVDTISVLFITLYNMYIGVLLYFTIMLGNPMAGPLKIEPASFKTLQEMGLEKLPF